MHITTVDAPTIETSFNAYPYNCTKQVPVVVENMIFLDHEKLSTSIAKMNTYFDLML